MEIGAWLRSLGLERYEPAFRENEIEWETLPKLTAEDLKDLGVVLGGHRRRLLDAIATRDAPEALPPATTASASVGAGRTALGALQPVADDVANGRRCPSAGLHCRPENQPGWVVSGQRHGELGKAHRPPTLPSLMTTWLGLFSATLIFSC